MDMNPSQTKKASRLGGARAALAAAALALSMGALAQAPAAEPGKPAPARPLAPLAPLPQASQNSDCHRQLAELNAQLAQNQMGANQTALGVGSFQDQARAQRQLAQQERASQDSSGADAADALADKLEADALMLSRSLAPIQWQGAQLANARQALARSCR